LIHTFDSVEYGIEMVSKTNLQAIAIVLKQIEPKIIREI
jgi:hypothetical protein